MTDYPIPDELRDRFLAALTVPNMRQLHVDLLADRLDRLAARGAHVELRLPEFAVHDYTCCGGSGERTTVHEGGSWEAGRRIVQEVPCPGVGYYHWTVTE